MRISTTMEQFLEDGRYQNYITILLKLGKETTPPSTDAPNTALYISTLPYYDNVNGIFYDPLLVSNIVIDEAIDEDNIAGDLEVLDDTRPWLRDYWMNFWGQSYELWIGDLRQPINQFELIGKGKIKGVRGDGYSAYYIELTGTNYQFRDDVNYSSVAGIARPFAVGSIKSAPAVLVDYGIAQYCIGDATLTATNHIVRDRGIVISPSNYTLTDNGNTLTFASWAKPAGPVTVDADVGTGGLASVLRKLFSMGSYTSAVTASDATMKAAMRGFPTESTKDSLKVACYLSDRPITPIDTIKQILADLDMYLHFVNGEPMIVMFDYGRTSFPSVDKVIYRDMMLSAPKEVSRLDCYVGNRALCS